MSHDLLPCPFCGCSATLYDSEFEAGTYWVECNECDCQLGYTYTHGDHDGFFTSKEEAIAAWNSRATLDRRIFWEEAIRVVACSFHEMERLRNQLITDAYVPDSVERVIERFNSDRWFHSAVLATVNGLMGAINKATASQPPQESSE